MTDQSKGSRRPVHVLIFPAGAENMIDIYDSLRHNPDFKVFGASAREDHGKAVYPEDHYCIGELQITEPDFLDHFNDLLRSFRIDYVIPTHDTVAVYLMKMAAEIQATIVCSPYETARIAENKQLTAEALEGAEYCPRVYGSREAIEEYPVFLKPWIGAGSRDTFLVRDGEELSEILKKKDRLLISEYLPGPEYTVGCFTSRDGRLLFAGPGTRERIQNGRAYHIERAGGRSDFKVIAEDLNRRLTFRGSWFFQVKEDRQGRLKLLEFSVRQLGEMALYRQLGVNFAALALYDAMGQDVTILFNDLPLTMDLRFSGVYRLRHDYRRVYLDAAALLAGEEAVDATLIQFLYQTVNDGKKITCLSLEGEDLPDELERRSIHAGLFAEIIRVRTAEEMTGHMTDTQAVFVSRDRKLRQLVKEHCRIPVFDVDALECL